MKAGIKTCSYLVDYSVNIATYTLMCTKTVITQTDKLSKNDTAYTKIIIPICLNIVLTKILFYGDSLHFSGTVRGLHQSVL